MRPSWDTYFMEITGVVAKRATCIRRSVGAILVKERHILASGYNGPPAGLAHCSDVGCLRDRMGIPSGERHELCRGLHAEMNALIQAAVHGISVEGSTLYVTHHPCSLCAKMLINARVERIVYGDEYSDELTRSILEESGIEMVKFPLI